MAARRARVDGAAGWLAVVVGVVGAFWPVATARYGFSDDYPMLWMATSGRGTAQFGSSILETNTSQGRPVGGVLQQMAFELAGSIDGLRFLRLASVVGVIGLALLLRWWLRSNGIHPWYASLVAVFVCVTPVFAVVTSWAVLVLCPFAAALAGAASVLTALTANREAGTSVGQRLLASLLVVLSFLIYPPAAMFFWVFFVVAVLGARLDRDRLRRVVVWHGAVAAASLAAGAVVALVAGRLVPTATGRMALVTDPVGKVAWFLTRPLYRSLSLYGIPYSEVCAVVALVLVGAAIVLVLARRSAMPAVAAVAGVAAIPLSFLPNLVVAENYSYGYRNGVALTSTVALLAALGALALADLWRGAVCRAWPSADGIVRASIGVVAALAVLASVAAAHSRVVDFVTAPQTRELAIVRDAVRALPAATRSVDVVRVPWESGPKEWVSDELGVPSTAMPWAADALVYLILGELGRDDALPAVTSTPWYEARRPGSVIDVRDAR